MSKYDSQAEKLNKQIFGNSSDYIDLEEYLEKSGIDVRYISNDLIDGYLRWDKNMHKPVIVVSVTGNYPVRMRFTMAHELAHLVLDYNWVPGKNNTEVEKKLKNEDILSVLAYRNKSNYTFEERKKETRADSFAASFLMPITQLKEIINDALKKDENADELVENVMKQFCVSRPAAYIRCQNVVEQMANEKQK
ncbi:ImmA/IrrE family metallo-endopeptidase [Lactobacillus panisapium]|uniref:ImmA/IrrE family metallo-endopeptidase n=1 Tax=Lactobacillus panisapium TaxID=2012495 RepID=UPI001C6A142D|nr:ImmA/IrrE family metallo-endopeptidase [Lactobacillus panisapium]QYN53970.1 ImmA/IrrE family metallo-endopeptidase [Lactobacillus panisapium]